MKQVMAIGAFVISFSAWGGAQAAPSCDALFRAETSSVFEFHAAPQSGLKGLLRILNRERDILRQPSSEPRAEFQNLVDVFAPRMGHSPEQIREGLDAPALAMMVEAYFKTQGIRGRARVFGQAGSAREDINFPRINPETTSFRRYVIVKYEVFGSLDSKTLRVGDASTGWKYSNYAVVGSVSRNSEGLVSARLHDPESGKVLTFGLQPFLYSRLAYGTYELVRGESQSSGDRAIVTSVITFEIDSNSGLQY